jgi:4-alpha-glucanotransferase
LEGAIDERRRKVEHVVHARRNRFNVPGTASEGNWTRRLPKTIQEMAANHKIRARMKLVRGLIKQSGRSG